MGIRPTEPVIRSAEEPAVRHVESKSDSRKFGEKEQPGGERRRGRPGQQDTQLQDEVDVSEQYQTAEKETRIHIMEEPSAPLDPSASPERHVDIQA